MSKFILSAGKGTSDMSSVAVRLSEPHSHGYGSESGLRRWITCGSASVFPANSASTGCVYQNIPAGEDHAATSSLKTSNTAWGTCDALLVVLIRRDAPEGMPRGGR